MWALDAFGFGSLRLEASDFSPADTVIQLGCPPVRIDLLTGIDGVQFGECTPRRQDVSIAGVLRPIVHLDDFEANKCGGIAAARDLSDLASLDDDVVSWLLRQTSTRSSASTKALATSKPVCFVIS